MTTDRLPRQIHTDSIKVKLSTFEHRNVEYLALLVDTHTILRRYSDSYVNATKLLGAVCQLRGHRRRLALENLQCDKQVVKGGHSHVSGTWIPLDMARQLADRWGKKRIMWPLLHNDPIQHIGVAFVV